jgi:hypothetical protein
MVDLISVNAQTKKRKTAERSTKGARSNNHMQRSAQSKSGMVSSILRCAPADVGR